MRNLHSNSCQIIYKCINPIYPQWPAIKPAMLGNYNVHVAQLYINEANLIFQNRTSHDENIFLPCKLGENWYATTSSKFYLCNVSRPLTIDVR